MEKQLTAAKLLAHVRKLVPDAFIFEEAGGNICISTCSVEVRDGKRYILQPRKIDEFASHL